MGGPTRESVYQALANLGGALQWGSPLGGFAYSSRKPQLPEELMGQMPALCQAEYREVPTQRTGMPQRRVWEAAWLIYHFAGNSDVIPATTTNLILDAVDALFPATDLPGRRQTLGGLVHKVWIEGSIEKFGGNIDPQVLIVVPLKILVP